MDPQVKLFLFCVSAVLCSLFLAVCIFIVATTQVYPIIKRSKKEKAFIDLKTGKLVSFPSLEEESTKKLSVVVPAYNEEDRLSCMLTECTDYLEIRSKDPDFTYEIIIVSDGSKDKTVKMANEWSEKMGADKVRVLDLETNRGKGGAVRLGVLSSRGAFILFADADGATKFSDYSKLESTLIDEIGVDYVKMPVKASSTYGLVIGSRAHLEKESIAKRTFFRTFLMYGFHWFVWLFTVRGIKDTQCGFKLFTRNTAKLCFNALHIERWAFDVELLLIAQKLNIPIQEVAVKWTEIEGSKLTPFWSSIQMAKDLAFIWLRYLIGAWKIKDTREK